MLRYDRTTYLSLLFKFTLSEKLINSQCESDVLLFLESMNIVFIFVLYLYWINYIIIYFFSNLFCSIQRIHDNYIITSQLYYLLLPAQELLVIFEAFVYGLNILSLSPRFGPIGTVLLSKTLRTFCLPLRSQSHLLSIFVLQVQHLL